MKYICLTIFALFTLLTLGACNKDADQGDPAKSRFNNDLLTYVPADSPYFLANLEPVPEEVIDTFLTRLQPVLDTMQSQLTSARQTLEADPVHSDDPGARFAHALLMEFDGKLSRPGLESLGFDLRSGRVVYGMGAFPVIRLGLSDAQALRDAIIRVMDNAGITAPEHEFQGVSYWRLSDEGDTGGSAGLYVSIIGEHLAISLFPTMAEAELLPAFLGLELPASSDAQARLENLNETQGYTGYGSGILDVRRLADQFMSPDTVAGRVMAGSGEFDPATLSQVCISEIHGIIDNTPLMTMGILEFSENAISVQYRLETPKTLASQLLDLVSKVPMADATSNRILEFAFGMRFGPVRDFLREKAASIVDAPYQCEHLLDLNDSAAQALAQLDQPMPPFLNNFRGVRASLSEIVMNQNSIPENARGYVAVHVEQPQMFVGMAQMFLPDLSEQPIAPGEPPVRLPESLIPAPGMVAFAAMSDNAIGLSLGEGEESGLTAWLDREAGNEGMFLSASYDMAAYLEYGGNMGRHYQEMQESEDSNYALHAGAVEELREAATRAMKQMADRSYSSMRFTPEGLVIENRTTFK